jgi:hypothetical protein
VIVVVPAATAATLKVTLDEPPGMVTEACTVATAGLLLDSEMLDPGAGAAAVRLTVPCALPPAARLVALSAIPDTPPVAVLGAVGDADPPH